MSTKMHATLEKWSIELEEETEILFSGEINDEARVNMVSFGFNEDLLREWGKLSVSRFLESCADLYEKKSNGHKMCFYSWLDEQAGQIRLSAVRKVHAELPFNCKVNKVVLSEMVDGIFCNNSGLFETGVLDVWCKDI